MHVAIDGKHIGHMEITLFNDTVPKTVNNFLGLSAGKINISQVFYSFLLKLKKCVTTGTLLSMNK